MARKESSGVFAEADVLLGKIRASSAVAAAIEAEAQRRIAGIQDEYAPKVARVKSEIATIESSLFDLAKNHHQEFFRTEDCRLALTNGALIYKLQRRVKRIRDMLENLEKNGMTDGVKISKKVDWDKIETWPDTVLSRLGTKRVPRDHYTYECI